MDKSGSAFPIKERMPYSQMSGGSCVQYCYKAGEPGLTKREYFAAAALQGILAKDGWYPGVADEVYAIADAMIAAGENND